MWWTPAGHDIARALRGAVGVNETLLTPPQAYRNVRITAAEMSRRSQIAQRKLADYYTGSPLTSWREIARRTLNPKDLHWGTTTAWMTWWRVDWVHLGERILRQIGDTIGRIEPNMTGIRLQLPGNDLEQRRLARAIRPHQPHPLAGTEHEGDVAENRVGSV
jgi:hypothetical protein